MNLQFNSVGELAEFLEFSRRLGAATLLRHESAADVHCAGPNCNAVNGDTHSTECQAEHDKTVDGVAAEEVEKVAESVADSPAEPRRKRRTKAEMEAARAAEQSGTPAVTEAGKTETTPAGTLAAVAPENTGNPFAQAELPTDPKSPPAAPVIPTTDDLKEFLVERIAERPELSQVEHLNLARGFIAKHGIGRYNESFALAGLSANVMTFSTADCATHAAVLDYLGSE